MAISQQAVDDLVASIPSAVRGPGGAVAVVHDGGRIVARHAWGYADLERRIAMTTRTILPICSISKHMLCLVIADLARDPTATMKGRDGDVWTQLDAELRAMLPPLFTPEARGPAQRELAVRDLFNMQSGIRDYWAMTVLWGARAEDPFSLAHDAPRAVERTRGFHFAPGSEFSYSNVNFHVLGRLVERVAGHSLGQLLAQRVFIPAGMKTADLSPNSIGLPLPVVGYEGSEKTGYVPATNGIEWQGDAGITASLEDMVAYEKYLHSTWKDDSSNYRAIAGSETFNDGSAASYSHGLWHTEIGGEEVLSHTGGLRGFRLRRLHVTGKGLSVVVMLNHETDPSATSELVLKPLLGVALEDQREPVADAAEEWEGDFYNEEQQRAISVELEKGGEGNVLINYGGKPEKLKLVDAHTAESVVMTATVSDSTLRLIRKGDGVDTTARRIAPIQSSSDVPPSADYAGTYCAADIESTFTVFPASPPSTAAARETILYASFTGFLGSGPIHLMRYIGEDIWVLTCPRSMDAPAPGEWSVVFRRGDGGRVEGVTVGCWLARRNEYVRQE